MAHVEAKDGQITRETEVIGGNDKTGITPQQTVTGVDDGRFSGASEELRAKLQRRRSTLHDPRVIAGVLSAVAAAAVEGTGAQDETSTLKALEARRADLEAEMDACLEAPDPENETVQATAARVWADMEAIDSAISNYIAEFQAKGPEVEDDQHESNDHTFYSDDGTKFKEEIVEADIDCLMTILKIHLRPPALGLNRERVDSRSFIAQNEVDPTDECGSATVNLLPSSTGKIVGRGDADSVKHDIFVCRNGCVDKLSFKDRDDDTDKIVETSLGSSQDELLSNRPKFSSEICESTREEEDIGVKQWSRSKKFRHAVSSKKFSLELSRLRARERNLHVELATKTAVSREHHPRRNFALEDVAGIIKLEQSLENMALLIRKKELLYVWHTREREIHDLRIQMRDRKVAMGPEIYPVLNNDDSTKVTATFKVFQSEIEGYRQRILKKKAEVERIENILLHVNSLSYERIHLMGEDNDVQTAVTNVFDWESEAMKSPSWLLSISPQKQSALRTPETPFSDSGLSISFTFKVDMGLEEGFLEMQVESAVATQVEGLLANFAMSNPDKDSTEGNQISYLVSCETASCLSKSEFASLAAWAASLSTKLRSSWFEESLIQALHVKLNIVKDSVNVVKCLPNANSDEVPLTPVTTFNESTDVKVSGIEIAPMLTPSSPSETSGTDQHLSTSSYEAENLHKVSNVASAEPESPQSFSSSPRQWMGKFFGRSNASSAEFVGISNDDLSSPFDMAAAEAAALDRTLDSWRNRSIETSECVICCLPLNPREASTQCRHECHPDCIDGLKACGVVHPCPLCSPPDQQQPMDDRERGVERATRRYFMVDRRVHRGLETWDALRPAYQREMDEVLSVWSKAAVEDNHFASRFMLAQAFENGYGVLRSDDEAEYWYKSVLGTA